jgi:serine/threonine-protein kinase
VIGSVVLNYRIDAQLGAGGLGVVYAGEHTVIGRKAALKVLNPLIARDVGMVARFVAEARAVNAIRHLNIVDVTDYAQADGHFVIVMELLDGETLAERLEKSAYMEERAAVSILTQAASALGAAHQRGIVHRDLKPENLFLTSYPDYPDFLKVLDFGIAKLMAQEGTGNETMPGLVMGTPAYMSPEQCRGDAALDHRSDIYSLGVVAYRMLTGRLPFEGNISAMMYGHMNSPIPAPRTLEPRVSQQAEVFLLKCLERDPKNRFQSMKEVRAALQRLGGRTPISSTPEEAELVSGGGRPAVDEQTNVPSAGRTVAPPPEPGAAPLPLTPAMVATEPAPDPVRHQVTEVVDEQFERTQAIVLGARIRDIFNTRLKANSLKLPSLPEVAVKALELANNPDVRFSSIAAIIEKDPFVSTRLVRQANAATYGGMSRVTNIEGAVARLGIKNLVAILREVAAEQVFSSRDPTIRNAFRGIWEHCLGVANLSRDIATVIKGTDPNTAYVAGLFHDLGKPVVASLLLETERGSSDGDRFVPGGVWRRVVDDIHRDVGAIITLRWFLPREVATAVSALDNYDLRRGRFSCANVVRLANAVCQREGLDIKAPNYAEIDAIIHQGKQIMRITDAQLAQASNGIVERVQALTTEKGDDDTGSTRVFDRSKG